MSYSGFTEYLCSAGHYLARDCWGDDIKFCHCGEGVAWWHSVDTTNGSDPEYPESMPADLRLIAEDDVWHTDHHGNRYATKSQRHAPNSREWKRVRRRTAQGIEARQGGDGTAPCEARKPDPKGCAHE